MKTFLFIFLITSSAFAQEKKSLGTSEILKFSLLKIRVSKGLEKNWKKCFGSEAPDLKNFLDVPTAIVSANAIKQLKEVPDGLNTCEAALDPSFTFAKESLCLIDNKVAQDLYNLTESPDALSYLTILEKTTFETNSEDQKKISDSVHSENAQDLLDFLRKFNKKKISSSKK